MALSDLMCGEMALRVLWFRVLWFSCNNDRQSWLVILNLPRTTSNLDGETGVIGISRWRDSRCDVNSGLKKHSNKHGCVVVSTQVFRKKRYCMLICEDRHRACRQIPCLRSPQSKQEGCKANDCLACAITVLWMPPATLAHG